MHLLRGIFPSFEILKMVHEHNYSIFRIKGGINSNPTIYGVSKQRALKLYRIMVCYNGWYYSFLRKMPCIAFLCYIVHVNCCSELPVICAVFCDS